MNIENVKEGIVSGLATVMILLLLLTVSLSIASKNTSKRDRYGNSIELIEQRVIMGDTNVLTVEELIEVYDELYH